MDRVMAFLEMGGYAVYVWPAYGVTALMLVALLVISVRTRRGRERDLEKLGRQGRENRL